MIFPHKKMEDIGYADDKRADAFMIFSLRKFVRMKFPSNVYKLRRVIMRPKWRKVRKFVKYGSGFVGRRQQTPGWPLTFLEFLRSHCLTPSSCARTSEESKNLRFGPPSFFGPRDSILQEISSRKPRNAKETTPS